MFFYIFTYLISICICSFTYLFTYLIYISLFIYYVNYFNFLSFSSLGETLTCTNITCTNWIFCKFFSFLTILSTWNKVFQFNAILRDIRFIYFFIFLRLYSFYIYIYMYIYIYIYLYIYIYIYNIII